MKLLAIDTSTEACSAALLVDGEVTERYEVAPREHAKLILPMAESLLAEAGVALIQLDALAFGRGPGSFTGIRIGTGVIQGMAFGADLPVVGVSTLAAMAQGMASEEGAGRVLAGIDARMHEVYWGAYQSVPGGLVELAGEEQVCLPEQVPLPPGTGWAGAGSAWAAYEEPLRRRLGEKLERWEPHRLPRAVWVLRLAVADYRKGLAVPAQSALPVYLRDNVARKST